MKMGLYNDGFGSGKFLIDGYRSEHNPDQRDKGYHRDQSAKVQSMRNKRAGARSFMPRPRRATLALIWVWLTGWAQRS